MGVRCVCVCVVTPKPSGCKCHPKRGESWSAASALSSVELFPCVGVCVLAVLQLASSVASCDASFPCRGETSRAARAACHVIEAHRATAQHNVDQTSSLIDGVDRA